MQIATNLSSLFGQRKLAENTSALDRSLQRLSSGTRINSAKDDAAGLAISERMTARVRGTEQARRNVNDGVSMLQVADGALSTITNSLQRVRELAVQAANGTLSASDRASLQTEAGQLIAGIDAIGAQTTFNGEQVFDQTRVGVGGSDVGKRAALDGLRMGWLEEAEKRIKKYYGIVGDGQTMKVVFDPPAGSTLTNAKGGDAAAVGSLNGTADGQGRTLNPFLWMDPFDFNPPNLPDGGGIAMGNGNIYNDRIIAHEMVHAVMGRAISFNGFGMPNWFKEGMAEFIHGGDERLFGDTTDGTDVSAVLLAYNANNPIFSSPDYSGGYLAVRYMHDRIKAAGGTGIKDIMTYMSQNLGTTLDQALTNASSGAFASLADFNTKFNTNAVTFFGTLNLTNADTGAIGGFDVDGGAVLTEKSVLLDVGTSYGDDVLEGFKLDMPKLSETANVRWTTLQVGAGADDKVTVGITAANAGALGISDIDLSTLPQFALVHVDQALNAIATARANIGAALARFDSTMGNLQTTGENLQSSRSRISDADFAQETTSLTRDQILRQSSTAMLAMANASPNQTLQLLQGV